MSSATTPRSSSAKKKVSRASAVAIGAMKRGSSGKKKPRAGGAGAGERSPSATAPGGADESSSPADALSAPREDTTRAAVRGATRESVTFADDATSPAAATPRAIEITERIPTGVPAERSPRDAPPPPSPARTHSSHSSLRRAEGSEGSSLVDELWDEKGNLRLGVALAGGGANTARVNAAHNRDKPLDPTVDQYRLMYLISRLQNVRLDANASSRRTSLDDAALRTFAGGDPANAAEPERPPNAQPQRSKSMAASSRSPRDGSNRVSPAPHDPPAGPTSAAATVAKTSRLARSVTLGKESSFRSALLWQRAAHAAIKDLREGFNLQRAYKSAPVGPLDEGEGEGEGLGTGGGLDADETQHSTRWVHRTPLLVYIYEGILLQVFDYDFSPSNELAGKGAINMNVSSEGVDDLSDLQEMGLILRLKLATKEHYTTTSYQVLPAGVAALRSMKQSDKDLVDEFLERGVSTERPAALRTAARERGARRRAARGSGAPPLGRPFEVAFVPETGEFELTGHDGAERVSSVTDFEDVSYVCSPYLPSSVRPGGEGYCDWGNTNADKRRKGPGAEVTERGGGSPGPSSSERPRGSSTPETTRREFSDFSHLAHLCRLGADTLREEQTHTVRMSDLRVLSSQYLVNGPNEVNALNEKLNLHASREELRDGQAGLVSAHVDNSPASTTFDVSMSGMCAIFPMDYVRSKLANFESKVYLPEDPGVVQLENFGIHVHSNGEVIFGVKVEGVMDKIRDDIPVDLISRLVFDLHEDSAATLESISSSHQRLMMASLRGSEQVRQRQREQAGNPGALARRSTAAEDLGHHAANRRAGLGGLGADSGRKVLQGLSTVGRGALGVGRGALAAVTRRSGLALKPGGPEAGRGPGGAQQLHHLSPSSRASRGLDRAHTLRDNERHDSVAQAQMEEARRTSVQSSMTQAQYAFNMYTAFLCESVTPSGPVEQVLLDGEDAENDIAQIVGRVSDAADLPGGGVIISGEKGVIVSGPAGRKFEQLIVAHCSVMARRIFVSSFFHRLFEMEAEIDSISLMIHTHIGKPSNLAEIRRRVMEACKQASLLDSLLTQAMATSGGEHLPGVAPETEAKGRDDPAYAVMLATLHTHDYREELITRLEDLKSLLKCARLGLDSLHDNTNVISELQMFKLQESLQSNTRNLESLFRSNESASSSLQIMQLVLGGTLAFSMMDRVTGEWTVMDTSWGQMFYETYIEPPGVWFCLSLLAFTVIVTGLHFTMRLMLKQASADMNVRYSLHVRISIAKMREILNERTLFSEEADTDVEGNNMYKVAWVETGDVFDGCPVSVEATVDQGHARLCTLNLKYNRREGKISVPEVQDRFFRMLIDRGVVVDPSELGDLVRPKRADREKLDARERKIEKARVRAKVKKENSDRNAAKLRDVAFSSGR